MMYILTEEEYKQLKTKKDQLENISKKKLQELCTKIADTMPVNRRWDPKNVSPWGCILNNAEGGGGFGYCDNCPVTEICPHPYKRYSK